MTRTRLLSGIGALAERFAGFLLDQWGVLHDGERPLPGAREAVDALLARGARIVLLSNSGRRAATNRARLAALGFAPERLAGVVTSGEAAWRFLKERPGPPWSELGRRCLLLTIGGDLGPVEGLDLELVADPEDADFLLVSGLDGKPAEAWRSLAEAARACDLPMICSNPDKFAPSPTGFVESPGLLAALYEALGGRVIRVGKPYPPIYAICLEALSGVPRQRILAVGDSLEHDVAGAHARGLATCLVASGIHLDELPVEGEADQLIDAVERLAARMDAPPPDFVVRHFRW
jgi:HAD superfamily hydrolase (TIGR01459 family)